VSKKQLERRRDELLAKMRSLKGDVAAARTRFMLFLVEVGNDPERAWAAGDDSITYEQFLTEHDICARATYQRFTEGLDKLRRTSLGSAMPVEELVHRIGHETVCRLHRIKTAKTTDRFVNRADDLQAQLGFPPSAQRLDVLLRELQPRAGKAEMAPEDDVKKMRAELEFLRAENARLQGIEKEVEELRPLKAEKDRLVREIALLREQLGGRRPRKAA
jgi:hypothetical protein